MRGDGCAVAINTVHVSGTTSIDWFCNRLRADLIGSVHTWARPFIASNERPNIWTGSVRTCKDAALKVMGNQTQKLTSADRKSIVGMQY